MSMSMPTLVVNSLVYLMVDSLHYWYGVSLHNMDWNLHVLYIRHFNELLNGNWMRNFYVNYLFNWNFDYLFYWVGNRLVNLNMLDFNDWYGHVSDNRHLNRVGLWNGHLYGMGNGHRYRLWHTVYLFPVHLVRLIPNTVAYWNSCVFVGSVVNVINYWVFSTR